MATPPLFLVSVYDAYSDNNIDKEVFLQAAGLSYNNHHVLIWWSNASTSDPTSLAAAQVIQLTGQAGNYSYYAPVTLSTTVTHTQNLQISLELFARAERDQILELAGTRFVRSSVING